MLRFIALCLGTLVRLLRAQRSLLLENLALGQQLAVRKRRHPRPRLDLLAPARSVVKQHFPINGRIAADLCTSAMPTQSSERRVYPRLPAPKGTIVAWHSFNKRVVSAVDNLGLGGLYIRTADPPATGTFIQLLLDAPAGEVRARAAVQRSSPKQGMGVKFVAMAQEDRARFARWLKALSS
jgi:hypothetical protein